MSRILIADDHELIRQGLRKLIQEHPGWIVCGEAVNGREAVARTRELAPDVLVLDFALPDLNGLEVTRQVQAAQPQTEVLILTMHESEQLARELLAAGARGFVFKSDAGQTLASAIQHLLQRRPYCTDKLSSLLQARFFCSAARRAVAAPSPLTPRERQVVRLIAEGRSSKEVAQALALSVRTVDTHRANLMRKLDLHSVSELVRYAIREHLAVP